MLFKPVLLTLLLIYLERSMSEESKRHSPKIKRSTVDEIKNALYKKVDVKQDGVQEVQQLSNLK